MYQGISIGAIVRLRTEGALVRLRGTAHPTGRPAVSLQCRAHDARLRPHHTLLPGDDLAVALERPLVGRGLAVERWGAVYDRIVAEDVPRPV